LQVLRIIEDFDFDGTPGESRDAAAERTCARIESELEHDLRREGLQGKATADMRGAQEDVVAAILRNANDASVLAMNSRGRGMIASILHGNVALGVLGKATLPVMLTGPEVLGPPSASEAYRLLMTTDLSEDSSDVIRALSPLLEGGKFKVTLFFVHEHAPGGQDNEADLKAAEATVQQQRSLLPASTDVEVAIRDIPRGGGVDTAILEKARDLDVDAVAMSTHGQGARKHAILGSTAMSMLGRSPVPLIVARV
jgi:nucleotide-binding universal stress UspA family protein